MKPANGGPTAPAPENIGGFPHWCQRTSCQMPQTTIAVPATGKHRRRAGFCARIPPRAEARTMPRGTAIVVSRARTAAESPMAAKRKRWCRRARSPAARQATATSSPVSRERATATPGRSARGTPHAACRPLARASPAAANAMPMPAARLTSMRAHGTRDARPPVTSHTSAGYRMRC